MNYTGVFVIILAAVMLGACGSTGKVEEPLPTMATGGMVAEAAPEAPVPVIPDEAEEPQTQPSTALIVPRVEQSQIVGIIKELVGSGCMIKKVANTDGIHYSQLVVTCGDVQTPPLVE